jgi:hypothetical protein
MASGPPRARLAGVVPPPKRARGDPDRVASGRGLLTIRVNVGVRAVRRAASYDL